jgi:hypothetical protein
VDDNFGEGRELMSMPDDFAVDMVLAADRQAPEGRMPRRLADIIEFKVNKRHMLHNEKVKSVRAWQAVVRACLGGYCRQ